jgi:hypothetical protein
MNLLRAISLSLALLAPSLAQAAAGQVLFALGRVEIQRGDQAVAATRGAAVEVGDVVSTGPTGLTQLRMQDGALLSLRYGSSMKVEAYQLPAAPAPVAGAKAPAAGGGRSALRLLRGAFRTVTGLIGKSAGDSYSVVTPVATIGIRGTDYSAAYCSGDCGATADGLYVGVSNGGIAVRNDAGSLDLGDDQYGYVRDGETPPERTMVPPEALQTAIAPDRDDDGDDDDRDVASDDRDGDDDGADYSDHGDSYETGDRQPEGGYELRPAEPGRYAYAADGFKGAEAATVYADGDGALLAFEGSTSANIGTAANFDTGSDGSTNLEWGRWHGGVANVTNSDGISGTLDLSVSSLHWIYATDDADRGTLPLTGSQTYELVGGTNPTDSGGNVGTVGSATLFADFTNLTVLSDVSLTMPGASAPSTWNASGSGSITSTTFSGNYTVSIDGLTGGTGGFGGFFTNDGSGAGLVFQLNDPNFTTTVSGALGFEAVSSPAAGGP